MFYLWALLLQKTFLFAYSTNYWSLPDYIFSLVNFFQCKKMHKLRCLFGHPKKVAIFWTTEKNHLLLIAAKSLLKKIWSCQSPGIIFVTQLQLPKLLGYFYFIKILRKYPQLRVGTAIKTNFWKLFLFHIRQRNWEVLFTSFLCKIISPFRIYQYIFYEADSIETVRVLLRSNIQPSYKTRQKYEQR